MELILLGKLIIWLLIVERSKWNSYLESINQNECYDKYNKFDEQYSMFLDVDKILL